MEFLIIVGMIVYLIHLNRKIDTLRDQIHELRNKDVINQAHQTLTSKIEITDTPNISAEVKTLDTQNDATNQTIINTEINSESLNQLWSWLARDWPMKVGGIFLILAVIWFVAYAFMNNWIGEAGRITLGLIAGSSLMLGGHWFITRQRHQGLMIELIGTVINLVTIFAAQNLYQMFSPLSALLLAVAVMIALTYSSLVYNDRYIATLALIIGGIAPLITGNYEPNILGLFGYLIALTIGSIWLSAFTNWRHLTLINLGIVWLYSISFQTSSMLLHGSLTPLELTQLKFFAISFTSLFFAANLATINQSKIAQSTDLVISLALSLYAFAWINALVPTQWQSFLTLALALTFFFGAYFVSTIKSSPYPVYTYAASALFLLTSATMIEFDGPVEIVALSLIATIVPLVTLYLFSQTISATLLFYFALPILLSLPSITSYQWNRGVFHSDAFALVILTTCLWSVGLYLRYQLPKTFDSISQHIKDATVVVLITASIYSLILVWLIDHAIWPQTFIARMLTLAIYLITGLSTYFYGQLQHRTILHRYGQILTGLVIAWLLLIETSNMELSGRILTFALTGVLLIGSVLLLNRFKKTQKS